MTKVIIVKKGIHRLDSGIVYKVQFRGFSSSNFIAWMSPSDLLNLGRDDAKIQIQIEDAATYRELTGSMENRALISDNIRVPPR